MLNVQRARVRRRRLRRSPASWPIAFVLLVGAAELVPGQLPTARLHWIYPPGGAVGTAFEVQLAGSDLDDARELIVSGTGVTAEPVTSPPGPFEEAPRLVPGRFRVKIASDAPSGPREIRAVGLYGISNPRIFRVGRKTELLESEPNQKPSEADPAALGSVVNGRIDGATDLDWYRIPLKEGDRLIAECFAQRIDSRLDATLVVADASGRELARNPRQRGRDPLVDFRAPADGDYLLLVYDVLYRGGADYFYRLSISSGPYIDFVFPPCALPGTTQTVQVFGRNLPGGVPAADSIRVDGTRLEVAQLDVAMPVEPQDSVPPRADSRAAGLDGIEAQLRRDGVDTEPFFMGAADAEVVLEAPETGDAPQRVPVPCEFVGQFFPRADVDTVEFEAKKGQVLWFETISHRLGHPTDPQFVITRVTHLEKGTTAEIAAVDDLGQPTGDRAFVTRTYDARHRLQVPADGLYRVHVRDLAGSVRSDPRSVYRLSIRAPKPDFRLVAAPRMPGLDPDPNKNPPAIWSPLLRRGGTERIDVHAFRLDGYAGPIALGIEGLPEGVTCRETVLAPGANRATLVLEAATDAAAWAGTVRIVGRAMIDGQERMRSARSATLVWPKVNDQVESHSRLVEGVALAVTEEPAPFLVRFGTPEELAAPTAVKVKVPVHVERRGDFKNPVAVILRDLPPNVKAKNITVAPDKTEGELELEITDKAPMGTFTLFLETRAEVQYRRNPAAADAAAGRRDLAVKAAAESTGVRDQRKTELESTARQKAELDAKAKDLRAKADELARQADAAAKQAAEIETQRAELEKALSEAEEKVKAAEATKKALEESAKKAAEAAKPKKIRVELASTPTRLTVAPTALRIAAPAAIKLRQGKSTRVASTIERRFGHEGEVSIAVTLPKEVRGLAVSAPAIDAKGTRTDLEITASADATVGTHRVALEAKTKWRGKDISARAELSIEVEAYVPRLKEF